MRKHCDHGTFTMAFNDRWPSTIDCRPHSNIFCKSGWGIDPARGRVHWCEPDVQGIKGRMQTNLLCSYVGDLSITQFASLRARTPTNTLYINAIA